jgi:hypothetical protein
VLRLRVQLLIDRLAAEDRGRLLRLSFNLTYSSPSSQRNYSL